MSNEILRRWDSTAADGAAIFAPSGEILRTWPDIDAEASEIAGRLSSAGGVVGIQCGNHETFPALLLGCWRAGRAVCLLDPDLQGAARCEVEAELGAEVRATVAGGSLRFETTGVAGPPACGVKISGAGKMPRSCARGRPPRACSPKDRGLPARIFQNRARCPQSHRMRAQVSPIFTS